MRHGDFDLIREHLLGLDPETSHQVIGAMLALRSRDGPADAWLCPGILRGPDIASYDHGMDISARWHPWRRSYRVKAALNCLRGRPVAYRITVRGGGIEFEPGALIFQCHFDGRPADAAMKLVTGE